MGQLASAELGGMTGLLAPRRVLVVDDEEDIRAMLVALLGDEGYEVTTAEDGLEGLRRAAETRPHVILCDLIMPRMNGYDFVENYRRFGGGQAAVLVMTAATPAVQSASEQLQPEAVVAKPVDVDQLLELLARFAWFRHA